MSISISENNLFETIFKVYGVALLIYDTEGTVLLRFSPNPDTDEILFIVSRCKEQLFELIALRQQPQIITSETNQVWAGVPILDSGTRRVVVLGPVYTSEGSKRLTADYVALHYASSPHKAELLRAFDQTPVCPFVELTKLLSMITYMVGGGKLDMSSLTISGLVHQELSFTDEVRTAQESGEESAAVVQSMTDFGKHLLECVREGHLEGLKQLLKTTTYRAEDLSDGHDFVRQRKNGFIILATQVTQAAIEGGLNEQIALSLRTLYVQRVETLHNIPAILKLYREVLYEAAIRVSNQRGRRRYSKFVNACCDIIEEHVHEKLLVTDVATMLGFNAQYVARRFMKETGQSIRDYINHAKVAEAKTLLKYSDLSLSEISEQLSFSSQSFFTLVFREITDVTPAQYRTKAAS